MSEIQPTRDIQFSSRSVFVVKVNGEELCYAESFDGCKLLLSKLADTLFDKLAYDDLVQSGRAKVYRDDEDRDIILGTVSVGWWNGPKQQVYKITFREVNYGVVRLPPQEKTA